MLYISGRRTNFEMKRSQVTMQANVTNVKDWASSRDLLASRHYASRFACIYDRLSLLITDG